MKSHKSIVLLQKYTNCVDDGEMVANRRRDDRTSVLAFDSDVMDGILRN